MIQTTSGFEAQQAEHQALRDQQETINEQYKKAHPEIKPPPEVSGSDSAASESGASEPAASSPLAPNSSSAEPEIKFFQSPGPVGSKRIDDEGNVVWVRGMGVHFSFEITEGGEIKKDYEYTGINNAKDPNIVMGEKYSMPTDQGEGSLPSIRLVVTDFGTAGPGDIIPNDNRTFPKGRSVSRQYVGGLVVHDRNGILSVVFQARATLQSSGIAHGDVKIISRKYKAY